MSNYYNRQWRLPNNENKDKQSNYSMDFDGSSQYITASNFSSLANKSTGSFSLWFKTTNTTSNAGKCIFSIPYSANGNGFDLYINNSSSLISYLKTSNAISTTSNTITYGDGNWHHVTVVYDGSTHKIYFDSVNVTNTSTSNPSGVIAASTVNTVEIGRFSTSYQNPFDGQIDGVAIFDYALSASQVTTLYGSSSTGIGNPMTLNPKPVAYYPLGDQDSFNGSNYLVPNSSLKDYVFSFDGSDDYINSGSASYLNGLSNFTFSSWVNISTLGTYDVIASDWSYSATASSNKGHFTVGLGTNDGSAAKIRIFIKNAGADGGSSMIDTNDYILNTGKWHHLLFTYNNGTVVIYINGVSYAVTNFGTIPTSLTSENSDLNIGRWQNVGRYFDGSISNVQIFNTALPATGSNSVETLYNNGSPLTSMSGYSSLQGWWKLDASDTYDSSTGNWTITDHSSNSNDGTSSGMTQANLVQSDLSFKTSISPFALSFDGTNDSISLNSDISLTGNKTVSFWFKASNITGNNVVIGGNQSPTTNYYPYITSTGICLRDSTGYICLSGITFNNDEWYHLCIVGDGTTATVYINGQSQGTLNDKNPTINTIGAFSNSASPFTGSISNVSVWNAALTSTQVTEIYSEGVPSNLNNHSAYSNLVSWWQLGSNSSFNTNWTVLDEKGSNNGTSVNMTEDDIVDGVGSYANGLSSGMGGDEVVGSAFGSSANALSIGMDISSRTTDTPS